MFFLHVTIKFERIQPTTNPSTINRSFKETIAALKYNNNTKLTKPNRYIFNKNNRVFSPGTPVLYQNSWGTPN